MRAIIATAVFVPVLIAAAAGAQTTPAKGTTPAKTTSAKTTPAKGTTTASAAGTGSGSAAPAPVPAPASGPDTAGAPPAPAPDLASVKPEDMPSAVRLRRLEQRTQALKERAWQLKARLEMLKEQTLGGGVGAQALIAHADQMGSSFRLTKLVYTLDGTQVFARTDETADSLYKTKSFDVFAGPISPGNHNLAITASYRGNGYGVFEYLKKFTFNAKGAATFTTGEGKISKVECRGFEKGGAGTPMEKRPAIDCKVTEVQPEKPTESKPSTTPGTTPLPPPAAPTAPPSASGAASGSASVSTGQ